MSVETTPKDTFAFPLTRQFLLEAKRTGAIDRFLEDTGPTFRHSRRHRRNRVENFNLSVSYFASPRSAAEIGAAYNPGLRPLSREMVRRIIDSTLKGIYSYLDPETQAKFPLSRVPRNKPYNLHYAIRNSHGSGGRMAEVAEMVAQGKTYRQIKEEYGIRTSLSETRRNLGRYGIELPYQRDRKVLKERSQKLGDPNLTYQEVKALFEGLSSVSIRTILNKHKLLTSLIELARSSGLHMRARDIGKLIEPIESARIAVATYQIENKKLNEIATGHCIRKVDQPKAEEKLRSDPSLDRFRRNPVGIICGQIDELPSSTDLASKNGYDTAGSVLREQGLDLNEAKVTMVSFFGNADCPVVIMKYHGVYYFPDSSQNRVELSEFIFRRRQELGI